MGKMGLKYVLSSLIFLSLLTQIGCSYREFEDSLRNKVLEGDESYANPAEIPKESEGSSKEVGETEDEEGKNAVGRIGDSIQVDFDVEAGEVLEYTLEKVEMGTDIENLGLTTEDFDDASVLTENGEIKESADCQLVVVTIKVKNVNVDIEAARKERGEEYPLMIEMSAGSESNILHPDGPFLLEACCFTGHPENEQDFYKFSLEEGEVLSARVGWLVPNIMLEEPFYYIISGGQSAEFYQYFQLNEKVF